MTEIDASRTDAATTTWSVVRTAVHVGGGFALAVGVMLVAGLMIGTD
ncbi:hypothetical protein [Agromyces sp. Root81]|nr:hypothetical protein [Agromyces sp. Root81]